MSCDWSREKLWTWVHGADESPAAAEHTARHVAECGTCGAAVASMRQLLLDIPSSNAPRKLQLPARIGGYEIRGRLGEGGMGVVLEAWHPPTHRRVALKVVRGGCFADDLSVRLFEREVKTLARLNHPNIASIFDAGQTSDGQPYFVMELVEGVTLTAWMLTKRPIAKIVELLELVCEAVGYAHQRGVIHRDLKPGNILVRNDSPVILDFGVARVTAGEANSAFTHTGVAVGTLPYMSPEQARGDTAAIDVRSDVYSLGVVLYEALSGCLPCDIVGRPIHDAVRMICERPSRPLRTISRDVSRDLSDIVMMAIEKEPDRRYASAIELASDLRRCRTNHPIVARPPSRWYRFRKLVSRHRITSGLIAAIFLLTVTAAIGLAMQRDAARREAAKFQRINDVLTRMLQSPSAWEQGSKDTRVVDVLDAMAAQIEADSDEDPLVAAALRHTLGQTYLAFSEYEKAERHLKYAAEARKRAVGESDPEAMASLADWGNAVYEAGDFRRAEQIIRRGLELRMRHLPREHPDVADSHNSLGLVLRRLNEREAAFFHLDLALRMRERIAENAKSDPARTHRERVAAHNALAQSLNNVAGLLRSYSPAPSRSLSEATGTQREALAYYERALQLRQTWLGERHPEVAKMHNNLAKLMQDLGELEQAESSLRAALAILIQEPGERHRYSAITLLNLADVLQERGGTAEAASLIDRAMAIQEQILPDGHPDRTRAAALRELLDGRKK